MIPHMTRLGSNPDPQQLLAQCNWLRLSPPVSVGAIDYTDCQGPRFVGDRFCTTEALVGDRADRH
jgi:hypothetical protein